MNSIKIARVCDWPILWSCIDMQAFLEFTNFYYRFIYSFSDIAHSLFDISSNNIIWTWKLEQEHIFTTLKTMIILVPVLVSLDTSVSFKVKVDSLNFATKVVLS